MFFNYPYDLRGIRGLNSRKVIGDKNDSNEGRFKGIS